MKLHHIVAGLLTNCSKNIRLCIFKKLISINNQSVSYDDGLAF
jgi:hypothetical protein